MDYYQKLQEMIEEDQWFVQLLEAVAKLGLEDSWLCAGVLRNFVWDNLSGCETPLNDIDVIYFDKKDLSTKTELVYEKQLEEICPGQPWSVRNQARMHQKSGFSPYDSSYDGVAHFPETSTAIAARLYKGQIEIIAPYGLKDLFEMKVQPTEFYKEGTPYHSIYLKRIASKKWENKWKELRIY